MKAVIYARYSSDNQREESIEGQLRECTAYCVKNDITILRTYIDRALSAKTDNRPDFQRMVKDSAKGLFDVVIVWKLDRFARNRYDSAHYKAQLRKYGVKVLSAMLGHVSAATTLDIYTHITDDMRLTAAANIDRGIGKAAPQEGLSELGQETAPAQAEKPRMTDFKPYVGRKRRSGTGCVTEINDHLFEGRYSPKWPDGKKHARNVYAHTREECEEKLKALIVEMKAEIAEAQRPKAKGTLQPRESEKGKKKGREKTKKAKKEK